MKSISTIQQRIYLAILILLASLHMSSCNLKNRAFSSNSNENQEAVVLDFNILLEEVEGLCEMKSKDYFLNYELYATLKQINNTDTIVELYSPSFIRYYNYEIINIEGTAKDSLIQHYDYSLCFNPETYESCDTLVSLKPNEFLTETLDLTHPFNFYLSAPDTLLIRIKKKYDKELIYSNWDTLILH